MSVYRKQFTFILDAQKNETAKMMSMNYFVRKFYFNWSSFTLIFFLVNYLQLTFWKPNDNLFLFFYSGQSFELFSKTYFVSCWYSYLTYFFFVSSQYRLRYSMIYLINIIIIYYFYLAIYCTFEITQGKYYIVVF